MDTPNDPLRTAADDETQSLQQGDLIQLSDMFTSNENRRPPGSRMQNGKLDLGRNDASWFAMPSRGATTGPSFAQTIGGQQARPLDPSEFPSLGGGAQSQQAAGFGSNTASWAANTARQRSPERPLGGFGRGRGRIQDDAPSSSFAPGADGYRFGSGQTNQTVNRGARSPFPTQGQDHEPIGYTGRLSSQDQQSLTNDGTSSPPAASRVSIDSSNPATKRLSDMTPQERYGMTGLIARLNNNHPDYDPLLNGFDLTKLGVNVDSSDPLINTWPGPFDENASVVPDFTLPPAYTVTNVPPLPSKIESFSDETLIMIFYQYPRDMLQELAAHALYKRDWRWHKTLRCWMMKDSTAATVKLDDRRERGSFIFFDVANWRRERKEIVLDYSELDTRASLLQGAGPANGGFSGSNPSAAQGLSGMGGTPQGFGGGIGGPVGAFGMSAFQGGLNSA